MERVLFAPRALPPLRPNVAEDPGPYSSWMTDRERARAGLPLDETQHGPLRIVMIVDGEPPSEIVSSLESLERQTSVHWQLTVVVENLWRSAFTSLLAVSGLRRSSQRVTVETVDAPVSPGQMVLVGMRSGPDEDVALLYPGDVWAPDSVAQLAHALSPGGVAYADEDRVVDHDHEDPRLKPDYSPEFLLHSFYMGRPMAIGGKVVRQLHDSGWHPTDEFEHDLALRACELADTVTHVPEVLCHRSLAPSPRPFDAPTTGHIERALERRHESAKVTADPTTSTYSIVRQPGPLSTVSVIIPFRDEPRFLRACVESIDVTRGSVPLELVLVDNGSVQPETATLLERLSRRDDVRMISDDRPFNWAGLNNAAAAEATGDIFVFLNNDIEATRTGWLDALCAQAVRTEVGVVGARLLYPDHRLQHCGVVVGLGGAAGHVLLGLESHQPGYLAMAKATRECSAVTGACLATRRDVFAQLSGFDESLGVDLNDIDYCLRAQRAHLRVLYEPLAELIHHESPSRGTAGDVRDIKHFIDRWHTTIAAGDPFLSPHLTRMDVSCALRGTSEDEWWQEWRRNLG